MPGVQFTQCKPTCGVVPTPAPCPSPTPPVVECCNATRTLQRFVLGEQTSFPIDQGVSFVIITATGGGGGGGTNDGAQGAGGGGSGGTIGCGLRLPCNGGNRTITWTIGAGGTTSAAPAGSIGGNGGETRVTLPGGHVISAGGGFGGGSDGTGIRFGGPPGGVASSQPGDDFQIWCMSDVGEPGFNAIFGDFNTAAGGNSADRGGLGSGAAGTNGLFPTNGQSGVVCISW